MFIVAGVIWPATALHDPVSENFGLIPKNMS